MSGFGKGTESVERLRKAMLRFKLIKILCISKCIELRKLRNGIFKFKSCYWVTKIRLASYSHFKIPHRAETQMKEDGSWIKTRRILAV